MIDWIILQNEKDLRSLEEQVMVSENELGTPSEYPIFAFLHANFDEEQVAEFCTKTDLIEMALRLVRLE